MNIWVDADACPQIIKEILFRAAIRKQLKLILVANQALTIPPSPYISKLQVTSGFDVADDKIIQSVTEGDLVITADIPLADAVISKGCLAINPRGELYTEQNIKHRLTLRNIGHELRSAGVKTKGPARLSEKEVRSFANALDRILR